MPSGYPCGAPVVESCYDPPVDTSRYRALFVDEARRLVSQAEVVLARPLQDGDAQTLMRLFHTFKGMSATMGFEAMTLLAHVLEDVFEAVRQQRVAGDAPALQLARDGVEQIVRQIDQVVIGEEPSPATALEHRARAFLRTSGTTAFTLLLPAADEEADGTERPRGASASDALSEVMAASTRLRGLVPDDDRVRAEVDRVQSAARRLYAALAELRQVTFDSVVPPLRRQVRSVATLFGKEVRLDVRGEGTLIDPVLLSALQGTFVHLVTNAIIHGVENPEDRSARGKPVVALLQLTAERNGAMISIIFTDDGRGFDADALRLAAGVERGDPVELAMRPGVSTASAVGLHAGRGQGLGAVRATIEAQGGKMTVTTIAGRGTRFRLDLPAKVELRELTLIQLDGFTFAVPSRALDESAPTPAANQTFLYLRDGRRLNIERLVGTVEALVSPPPFPINRLPQVTGSTLAPDGSVLFVLDPSSLATGVGPVLPLLPVGGLN